MAHWQLARHSRWEGLHISFLRAPRDSWYTLYAVCLRRNETQTDEAWSISLRTGYSTLDPWLSRMCMGDV
jgi:hypothetical protein